MSQLHALLVVCTVLGIWSMFVLSCVYVRQDFYLKIKQPRPKWMSIFPSLETLHRWILRLFYAVLIVLTVLVVTGLILAHEAWESNWLLQPKLLVALATWLYFMVMFVIRRWKGFRGTRFFVWLIVGCILISCSLYGAYAWV